MSAASKPRTALVLCGGGSRGAAEVGFYRALREAGVQVDMIVGTSVGAVNGAFIASGLEPDAIKNLWLNFHKWRPFRFNWRALWQWHNAAALFDPSGFRNFLKDTLAVSRFEDLEIPLTVVATNLQKAESVCLEEGDLMFAIMASIALPLYFPPLPFGRHQLVDGGVTNNVPLDVAVRKGATRVYAMLCGCQDEMDRPVSGFLNIQSRAFNIATRQKLYWDLEHLKDKAEIIVLEPCLSSAKYVLDFSRTELIIEEAYQFTKSALSRRANQGAAPAGSPSQELKT